MGRGPESSIAGRVARAGFKVVSTVSVGIGIFGWLLGWSLQAVTKPLSPIASIVLIQFFFMFLPFVHARACKV